MTKFQIIRSDDQLAALIPEWRALHDRLGGTVFTDPSAFQSWWTILGKPGGSVLHVVAGWRHNQLVALAPLVVQRRKGLRVLCWGGEDVFDYCDSLAETETDTALLWQAVHRSPHYDIARLNDVLAHASCYGPLMAFARVAQTNVIQKVARDWPSGEAWFASLSSRARQVFRRNIRQIEEKGQYSFAVAADWPSAKPIIDAVVRQKCAWTAERDKKQISGEMIYKFSEAAAAANKLSVAWIGCDNQIVAAIIGIIEGAKYYTYVCSYDGEWASIKPGLVVFNNLIRWAMDNGIAEIDFMRGEYEFKERLANAKSQSYNFLFTGSVLGWASQHAYILIRAYRNRRAA